MFVPKCVAMHPSRLHVPSCAPLGQRPSRSKTACMAPKYDIAGKNFAWHYTRCMPHAESFTVAVASVCRAHLGLLHRSLLLQQHVLGAGHLAHSFFIGGQWMKAQCSPPAARYFGQNIVLEVECSKSESLPPVGAPLISQVCDSNSLSRGPSSCARCSAGAQSRLLLL